jgi:hypothetical protein
MSLNFSEGQTNFGQQNQKKLDHPVLVSWLYVHHPLYPYPYVLRLLFLTASCQKYETNNFVPLRNLSMLYGSMSNSVVSSLLQDITFALPNQRQ